MSDYLRDIVDEVVDSVIEVNLEILKIIDDLMEREGIASIDDMKEFDSYKISPDAYVDGNKAVAKTISLLPKVKELELSVLLPELFLQVEEATKDADMENLTWVPLLMDPDYAKTVSSAVIEEDMQLLRDTVTGGHTELILELVNVIAFLKIHSKTA